MRSLRVFRSLIIVAAALLGACGASRGTGGAEAFADAGDASDGGGTPDTSGWFSDVALAGEDAPPADVPAEVFAADIGPPRDLPPDVGLALPDVECVDQTGLADVWSGNWTGEIEGFMRLSTAGTITFAIRCGDIKLPIVGSFDGLADDEYPFRGDLLGELDLSTSELVINMVDAEVVFPHVEFVGIFRARLEGMAFVDGTWEAASTSPVGHTGQGTWAARLEP